MNFLSTVTNSSIIKGARSIIATIFGGSKEAPEASAFGVDSCPLPGMSAVYIQTSKRSQPVFIGYINTSQLALPGENRIYATDTDGNEASRIWQHNDGSLELGGTGDAGTNANHAVQWEALKSGLDTYISSLNSAISAGVSSAGGSYVPPTSPLDIAGAKLEKILVP